VERIRKEKSVLVVAGDHFGKDNYLRIGYGPEPDYLKAGLNRIDEVLRAYTQE
jgi:aspartate/methionine/tyrosine aminotransferase